MSFWAIELVPGQGYQYVPPYDLHVTQAVISNLSTDTGRSVVQFTNATEENKEVTFAIAALKLGSQESAPLDLVFDQGTECKFSVTGKNRVSLSGYFINEPDFDDEDIDSDEEDGLDNLDDEVVAGDDDEDDDDDNELEDDEGVEEAVQASAQKHLQSKKRQGEQAQDNSAAKKPKTDAAPAPTPTKGQQQPKQQTPQGKSQQQPKQQTPQGKPQQQQQQKTPQQQQQKTPQQQTPGGQKGGQQQKDPTAGKRRTLEGGLTLQTTKAGTGAQAEVGKKVRVHYVGRLTNGKVFDKSDTPFSFRLGAGEVIKGWDKGVQGMRVGEKRNLVIPPAMAYGKRSMGGIPANSTLVFDVELVGV